MHCTMVRVLERRCSNATFDLQFDEEIMGRQEALAQLLKKEEKINELEAEVQAFRSQVLLLFYIGDLKKNFPCCQLFTSQKPFNISCMRKKWAQICAENKTLLKYAIQMKVKQ